MAVADAAQRKAATDFPGEPAFLALVAGIVGVDNGTSDLTTAAAASFNARNLPQLRAEVIYSVVAGEADTNGNFTIDNDPDEYAAMRVENDSLRSVYEYSAAAARTLVDRYMYQVLRNTRAVHYAGETIAAAFPFSYVVVHYESIANDVPERNDCLVPQRSAEGALTFWQWVDWTAGYVLESYARNHASIGDQGIALDLVPYFRAIEVRKGDLRS